MPHQPIVSSLAVRLPPLFLCLLGAALAHAEAPENTVVLEETFLEDLPVVLSASRLEQSLHDAPSSVTILDNEMIHASGARNIADLFRLVPGYQVAHALGYQHVVTYHGLSDQYPHRLQILIDGRAIYQPTFGGPEWADLSIDIEDISHIEVIRGTNAASYGSNSFMGVINIVTMHSAETQGAYLRHRTGNVGVHDNLVQLGDQLGNATFRVSMGERRDDGAFAIANASNGYDKSQIRFANARIDQQLGANDEMLYEFGLTDGSHGTRFSYSAPLSGFIFYDIEVDRTYEFLRWTHYNTSENFFHVQFFHNYTNLEDVIDVPLDGIGLDPFTVDKSIGGERYDLEVQHTFAPAPGSRMVWGLGTRMDRVDSPFNLHGTNKVDARIHRVFANLETQIAEGWLSNLGFMVEHTPYDSSHISPRVSLSRRLAPDHSLRLAAARAYRPPFILEEEIDARTVFRPDLAGLLGGPQDIGIYSLADVGSERVDMIELAYLGKLQALPLTVELRLFSEKLKDIITPVDVRTSDYLTDPALADYDDETLTLFNYDDADIRGLEGQLTYRPGRHSRLIASYTYLDIASSDREPEYIYSDSAPRQSWSLFAMFGSQDDLHASFAYYRVGETTWLGSLNKGKPVPAYERFDSKIGIGFKNASVQGEFALVMQNAQGTYQEFRAQNVFDSRFYAALSLYFH
ncbi:MAG: TonB-dependent receptor [Pseudomonadota bacterium]